MIPLTVVFCFLFDLKQVLGCTDDTYTNQGYDISYRILVATEDTFVTQSCDSSQWQQTCYDPVFGLDNTYITCWEDDIGQQTATIDFTWNTGGSQTILYTNILDINADSFENCDIASGEACLWRGELFEDSFCDRVDSCILNEFSITIDTLQNVRGYSSWRFWVHCSNDPPTPAPTMEPTLRPSDLPSTDPSNMPSIQPSASPTLRPSNEPSIIPSTQPSVLPTLGPSPLPTMIPSFRPTRAPLNATTPTRWPTIAPSNMPSVTPSNQPTYSPTDPTSNPSEIPSLQPSNIPSTDPSHFPSTQPSPDPSASPSYMPTEPTVMPSAEPSRPTYSPTKRPSFWPTEGPSPAPTLSGTDLAIIVRGNNNNSNFYEDSEFVLIAIIAVLSLILCLVLIGVIFCIRYQKKQALLIESINEMRYKAMLKQNEEAQLALNSSSNFDDDETGGGAVANLSGDPGAAEVPGLAKIAQLKPAASRLSLMPGSEARKKEMKFRGSVANYMARNKELDKLKPGLLGNANGPNKYASRLSVAPGAGNNGRMSIMNKEGGVDAPPAAFSLNFSFDAKSGQVAMAQPRETDYYEGFISYTGDLALANGEMMTNTLPSHLAMGEAGKAQMEALKLKQQAKEEKMKKKQIEFGQVLGDARVAEEMVFDDLVNEIHGNDSPIVEEENEDPMEAAGMITKPIDLEESEENNNNSPLIASGANGLINVDSNSPPNSPDVGDAENNDNEDDDFGENELITIAGALDDIDMPPVKKEREVVQSDTGNGDLDGMDL